MTPSIQQIQAVHQLAREYKPKRNSRFGFAFPTYQLLRNQGASHSEAAQWLTEQFGISADEYKALAACMAGHLTRQKRNEKKQ